MAPRISPRERSQPAASSRAAQTSASAECASTCSGIPLPTPLRPRGPKASDTTDVPHLPRAP
eukprot:8946245-Alexandrium_andersonii.AAC.1